MIEVLKIGSDIFFDSSKNGLVVPSPAPVLHRIKIGFSDHILILFCNSIGKVSIRMQIIILKFDSIFFVYDKINILKAYATI